jgi:putative hydrolase of the HAD superfamily/pyrimidine and pyridine-specific 5'-nucleotidase
LTVDDLFTTIVDTRTCDLETKHHDSSFQKAMAACNVPASEGGKCILLDDSVTNIKKAKAMGWTTVLVGTITRGSGGLLLPTPTEADHHISSLRELPNVMPELFLQEPVVPTQHEFIRCGFFAGLAILFMSI